MTVVALVDGVPADKAHRDLRRAIDVEKGSRLALAAKVYAAYEAEAWLHDDGEHVARYRNLMAERKLNSVFEAYCLDEFGRDLGNERLLRQVGYLMTTVSMDTVRFTERALRPLAAAGVINTVASDDLAATIDTAQAMASDEMAGKGRATPKQIANARVTERHIRAAMKRHGVTPLTRTADPDELVARQDAKRIQLIKRAERDLRALSADPRALKLLRDLIIRMLGEFDG